jgi:hypothetical protein
MKAYRGSGSINRRALDLGTCWRWMISLMLWPLCPVPIGYEAWWASEPVWTWGGMLPLPGPKVRPFGRPFRSLPPDQLRSAGSWVWGNRMVPSAWYVRTLRTLQSPHVSAKDVSCCETYERKLIENPISPDGTLETNWVSVGPFRVWCDHRLTLYMRTSLQLWLHYKTVGDICTLNYNVFSQYWHLSTSLF